MKICFVADIRSIHTRRWVEFFSKKYDTHLLSFDYPEETIRVADSERFFKSIGVTVHKIRKSNPFLLLSPIEAKKIIRNIKPDLVHAHFVTQYGFFSAFSGQHPLVITAWGDDVLIHPRVSVLFRQMVRYALRNADIITCDGDNTERAMIDLGANPSKIKKILFGVDTIKFNPEKANTELFVKKFGFTGSKVIIYLRGFDPVYSAETLIDAIPLILKQVPNAKFLLLGGGTELECLQQKVSFSSFKDSIYFPGRIPNEDLPVYLATSDVYVSTSLSDSGIAASTAEAMACGVPVISTECGDIRLWIQDGENGFVIQKKNPSVLAERVITLLKDDSMRKQFGTRCRSIIESKQDYYKEMNKMDEIYTRLVEEKRI